MSENRILLICFFITALTACGGDSSEVSMEAADSPVVEAPDPALSGNSVIDIASQSGSFETFSKAVEQTEWFSRLAESESTFTIFAPTDSAFALMDEEGLDNLLADQDALTELLNYHIVLDASLTENEMAAKAQSENTQIEMANGEMAALSSGSTTLFINQSVISGQSLVADNGIVHPIQQINFAPKSRGQTTQTLWDIVVSRPEFSTLLSLLQAAELQERFENPEAELTLFAPTNDAFSSLDGDALAALQNDTTALRNLLLRHTVSFEISSVNLFSSNNVLLDAESGEVISISIADFTQYPNTDADEIAYDLEFQRYVGGQGSISPGHTLYLLETEKGVEISQCNGECLDTWPPLLITDGVLSRVPGFDIFERDNGVWQVSYKGNPVYFFAGDSNPKQANGQGIDNLWRTLDQPQVSPAVQNAAIIEKDIFAANGVLHLIDAVITEVVE